MKNKNKYYLIFILILVLFIVIGYHLIKPTSSRNSNTYQNIIDKIDRKETFNILITDSEDEYTNKVFEYYRDVYSLKYEQIKKQQKDIKYKKLLEKTTFDISDKDEVIFVIVKDGVPSAGLIGEFSEEALREFLITNNIINKKYNNIDLLIEDDFKDFYINNNDNYSILLINYNDKELNDYRKLLAKNDIKSVVIYNGDIDIYDIEEFKRVLGSDIEAYNKSPIIINIKNKKMVNYYENVKLDDLLNYVKFN